MSSNIRFAIVALLLAATALLLHARSSSEVFPWRQVLAGFPHQLGDWTGADVNIPQDILDILGPGDFLLRDYQNPSRNEPDVELFMAYFRSQKTGDTIHSPKHCLPGAGWWPVESRRVQVSFAGHAPFQVNRYVIRKGEDRQLVLYWYWAHDRAVASEYWAKFYLIADSIRMDRSDGSLIRVNTLLSPNESVDHAQQRLLAFAGLVVPLIDDYVPR